MLIFLNTLPPKTNIETIKLSLFHSCGSFTSFKVWVLLDHFRKMIFTMAGNLPSHPRLFFISNIRRMAATCLIIWCLWLFKKTNSEGFPYFEKDTKLVFNLKIDLKLSKRGLYYKSRLLFAYNFHGSILFYERLKVNIWWPQLYIFRRNKCYTSYDKNNML